MSDDSDILKAEMKFPLDREQEVLSLRARQEQIAAWLSVAQALPGMVDGQKPVEEILSQVAQAVAAATRMQQVLFFYRLALIAAHVLPAAARHRKRGPSPGSR